MRHARCAHTDDDNPASVSQKGKMGGEDECTKEEEVKGMVAEMFCVLRVVVL